jgi:hypothetical protein
LLSYSRYSPPFTETGGYITGFRRARNWSPILSQFNPVHIRFNITSAFSSTSSKWAFPFSFRDKHYLNSSNFSHACYVPCPFHHPNNVHWTEQIMKLLSDEFCPSSINNCALTELAYRPTEQWFQPGVREGTLGGT